MATAIHPDHAEELYESDNGDTAGPWTRVGEQKVGTRRWSEDFYLIVVNADGEHFGVPYALGLTENQPHDLPWEDTDEPIPLVRMYPHEVSTVVYKTAPLAA